jgi:hypothetical protein
LSGAALDRAIRRSRIAAGPIRRTGSAVSVATARLMSCLEELSKADFGPLVIGGDATDL